MAKSISATASSHDTPICIGTPFSSASESRRRLKLASSAAPGVAHLHYDVLVNGKPQDPEKFISLAGEIPVASQ
jgi:hypothetical protein